MTVLEMPAARIRLLLLGFGWRRACRLRNPHPMEGRPKLRLFLLPVGARPLPARSSRGTSFACWEKRESTQWGPPAPIFSVYVALTYIPGGGLLTGFAMRSDPNVVFGYFQCNFSLLGTWLFSGAFFFFRPAFALCRRPQSCTRARFAALALARGSGRPDEIARQHEKSSECLSRGHGEAHSG